MSGVKSFVKDRVHWIVLDNPKRKNAMSEQMYNDICHAFDEANESEETFITVFTGGEGEYYSSGNDFSPSSMGANDQGDMDFESGYSKWMRRLIDHRKILIALVNGPAIGIAATTLVLFDYVVASDSAYFVTPFPTIGVCPEGCSSQVFARIMGTSKANEMLYFGEKMDARRALETGFVAQVYPKAQFKQETDKLIEKYSKLPKHSVLASKEVCRGESWRREMKSIHDHEYRTLKKLFSSEETVNLILSRFAPKNKM